MKRYILLFLVVLFVSDCSKNALNKTVYGGQSLSTFYSNTTELNEGLTDAYYGLKVKFEEVDLSLMMVGDVSTDDALKGGGGDGDQAQWTNMANFTMTSSNAESSGQERWIECYQDIYQCNLIITNAPKASGDPVLITRMVNEAKFLRALNYYWLVTMYGGVPLVLQPLAPSQVFIPRSTPAQVFAQIASDCTAATALPTKSQYAVTDAGRATSGAAWALLGRAYMYQRNFPQAEIALNNVIQSNQYTLLPDYGSLWNLNNKNNAESIFEINYQSDGLGWQNSTGTNLQWFLSRTNEGGYGFHCPSQDLFNEFDPQDPRIPYTFTMTGDQFQTENFTQDNSQSPTGYMSRKQFVPKGIVGSDETDVPLDFYVIRYADVLLMYAEALNEDNKSAQALPYLEMVRSRARNTNPMDFLRTKQVYNPGTTPASLPPVTTTDQTALRAAIWHERRCELGMEGLRRDDLLRQNRFGPTMLSYAAKYNTVKGKNFTAPRDNLMPIPLTEINLSNGTLTQNPGF
jgi:starch-binding outer membrane protein, SusD/RagB family